MLVVTFRNVNQKGSTVEAERPSECSKSGLDDGHGPAPDLPVTILIKRLQNTTRGQDCASLPDLCHRGQAEIFRASLPRSAPQCSSQHDPGRNTAGCGDEDFRPHNSKYVSTLQHCGYRRSTGGTRTEQYRADAAAKQKSWRCGENTDNSKNKGLAQFGQALYFPYDSWRARRDSNPRPSGS
jgi:hypothetical protein